MGAKHSRTVHATRYVAYALALAVLAWEPNPRMLLALSLWAGVLALGLLRHLVLYGSPREKHIHWVFFLEVMLAFSLSCLGYSVVDMILYMVIIYDTAISSTCTVSVGLTLLSILGMGLARLLADVNNITSFAVESMAVAFVATLGFARGVDRPEELLLKLASIETAYDDLVQNQLSLQGAAVLEERARMAREVHDSVSRSLTAIIVTTEALERRLAHGTEDIAPELNRIKEQARLGLKDTRHSLSKLRPSPTDESFLSSLRALVEQIQRWYGVQVELSLAEFPHTTSPDHVTVLFRVIQEAATNAIRHGKCTVLMVHISGDQHCLKVVVKDNGAGCSHIKLGYGLTGMTERIRAVGGDITFTSKLGKGFEVFATLPRCEV